MAVANRDCTDRISIAQADSVELHIFEAMLSDPADAFAPMKVQKDLQQNMGSKQLILKLDQMLHTHTVQHRKPAALMQLQSVLDETVSSVDDLGNACAGFGLTRWCG